MNNNLEEYVIVTDSSSGFSKEEVKKLNIKLLPYTIITQENKIILDDFESISNEQVNKYIKSNKNISTSQTPLKVISDFFFDLIKKYKKVLYLCASNKLSKQFSSTSSILNYTYSFQKRVFVLDTKASANLLKLIVISVVNLFKTSGFNLNLAKKRIKELLNNSYSLFIPSQTIRLKKSGRFSKSIAKVFDFFKMSLVVKFSDGENKKLCFARTFKQAIIESLKYLKLLNLKKFINLHISITYNGDKKVIDVVENIAKKIGFLKIVWHIFPRIISIYTGLNTISFVLVDNEKKFLLL